MVLWLLFGYCTLALLCSLCSLYIAFELRDRVKRLEVVLSGLSSSAEKKIEENSSGVSLGERWYDEAYFEQ